MTALRTALSTVADGSMLNRHDDSDARVVENRRRFLSAQRMKFETTTRLATNMLERATVLLDTDYCRYAILSEENVGDAMFDRGTIVADALVTTRTNEAIILPVADCVGAVLYDPQHGVLMVSHLGRHSLEQQGALRSVEFLTKHFGSNPRTIQVRLTPAPGKAFYQIWALDNKGMKEATLEQLASAGIRREHISDDSRDTVTDTTFYSYSEFLKGNRNEDGDHMIAAVMS